MINVGDTVVAEGAGAIAGDVRSVDAEGVTVVWRRTTTVEQQDELTVINDRDAPFDREDLELVRLALWLLGNFDYPTHAHAEEVINAYKTGVRAPLGIEA